MSIRLNAVALAAFAAITMSLAGCSSFKAYRIESLPPEYAVKASPAYVKQWMQLYKTADRGLHFTNIQVTKTQAVAQLRQAFGDTLLAYCTVELVDAPNGEKHVDVSLNSANSGYMSLDGDAEEIKRQLHLFLMNAR